MFCVCCSRIVAIRVSQGRAYWLDLCPTCRLKALKALRKKTEYAKTR